MPHFIVEHSANLGERHNLQALAKLIADVAAASGVFPLAGIRVRFHESAVYHIADGHPQNAFLSIISRIGAGRDGETKRVAAKQIFEAVCAFLGNDLDSGYLMVSFDMDENDPDVSFKKNAVHGRLSSSV